MSIKVMSTVWEKSQHSGSELLCLLALADWSDDDGFCFPAVSSIAKKIRLKERQAQRVVHKLIADGVVRVIGNEFGGAPGTSRKYRLITNALTGVLHDTGVLGDTGVAQDVDGCHPRRITGVAHDTLTVIEPSLTVSSNRALRFDEFWRTYPNCKRKGSKAKCQSVWQKQNFDSVAEQIISHVKSMATSDDWLKDSGKYIPGTLVYLNQQRWDGAEVGNQSTTDDQFEGAI